MTAKPIAWVIHAPNGNIRMWQTNEALARKYAEEWGLPLTPLYEHTPADHGAVETSTPSPAGKWRKRPVVIEALQYNGENADEVQRWGGPDRIIDHGWHLHVDTLEGEMRAEPGDWIITGVAGEHYPCKPDIFAQTYEPAHPPADHGASGSTEPKAKEVSVEQHELIASQQAELQRVKEERDDARSTLAAWFDLSKKTEAALEPEIMSALRGYLRTAKNGGMPTEDATIAETILGDFCRLYLGQTVLPILRTIQDDRAEALREAVGAVAEPTDEMIEAGEEEITSRRQMGMRVYAADIWRAMSKHVLSRLTEHTPQTEKGTP